MKNLSPEDMIELAYKLDNDIKDTNYAVWLGNNLSDSSEDSEAPIDSPLKN